MRQPNLEAGAKLADRQSCLIDGHTTENNFSFGRGTKNKIVTTVV